MTVPKTLLELAGADLAPAGLSAAALVLIDMQNEYSQGPIAVTNAERAVSAAQRLLAKARDTGTPVVHVAHKGRAGGLFDRKAARGQLMDAVAPLPGEAIVEKGLPNAFAGTDLHDRLGKIGRNELILVGFMTHMCVSSTARAALDLGYRVTVDADSCGTRDLPDGRGGIIEADVLHKTALAELADRFAIIARDHDWAG